MSEYILEMNHITKAFSGVKALADVNLKLKKGESITISSKTFDAGITITIEYNQCE